MVLGAKIINQSNSKYLLCTLFDSGFLLQGLSLIESVTKYSSESVDWVILALDNESHDALAKLDNPRFNVLHIDTFPDEELKALRSSRPWREFCWTSASCLLNYSIANGTSYNFVGYVDADCYFMSDINEMIKQIPNNKNIGIHEHRFSPDRADSKATSGRFNVGVVIGKPKSEFVNCISRWRLQTLDSCELNPDLGKCGDQMYLDEWPDLYDSLYIFESKGVGLGPWNLNNYEISHRNNEVFADSDRVYFYHFHGLTIKRIPLIGCWYVPASGYNLKYTPISEIYRPYMDLLVSSRKKFGLKTPYSIGHRDFSWFIKNFYRKKIYSQNVL